MKYNYCGKSGVQLPALSLGLWHNFGSVDSYDNARNMILHAFDKGICHFDLANNYGPVPGSAEENFGKILHTELKEHRDEMFISSKAGHTMWPGVYGDGSSRKNLIASCDQSLRRMGLDYVDVFYSHRYDGITPIEETMQALVDIVRSGKALYAGISKYPLELQRKCYEYLRAHDVPCLLSQYRASIFEQSTGVNDLTKTKTDSTKTKTKTKTDLTKTKTKTDSTKTKTKTKTEATSIIEAAHEEGSGFICFSPLAQGLLTNKYLHGIPENSRAAKSTGFLQLDQVTPERIEAARRLNDIAAQRGQSLAQMALTWLLHDCRVTSVIIGTSSVEQMDDNLKVLDAPDLTEEEMQAIQEVIGVNRELLGVNRS